MVFARELQSTRHKRGAKESFAHRTNDPVHDQRWSLKRFHTRHILGPRVIIHQFDPAVPDVVSPNQRHTLFSWFPFQPVAMLDPDHVSCSGFEPQLVHSRSAPKLGFNSFWSGRNMILRNPDSWQTRRK